jgi:hypothetical protein
MAGNLRRAAEFVEMNLSQMGKDERRTRIGYKDQVLNAERKEHTWAGDQRGQRVCVVCCSVAVCGL